MVDSDSTSEQEEEPQREEAGEVVEEDEATSEVAEPRLLPADRNEVRNKQMFFGGLPLNPERPTLIKQL